MKKLAIITTHPIQYYAPVFKLLHERGHIAIHVFYTWGKDSQKKYDPGFKQRVNWDIPLLEGYPFSWMENIAARPGSHHFNGIKNPELISDIKNFAPEAILIFGWAYQSHLNTIRYFSGKFPIFFRGDSTLLDENISAKAFAKRLFLRWVYSHVDHAFYVGKNNKAYFKHYGLKEYQLSFAPHAVDNDRFAADHLPEAQKLRREMGIAESDTVVLFAGKFEPKKDPLILLEAFGQLNRNDAHLIFAGNGVLEEKLKAISYQLSAHKNIHFLPFQNQTQMPALYQACDVFCLPSKGPGETWGLAVNEAMASGKAVIVSNKVGCAADMLKEGRNGYIFLSQNKNALKETLSRVFSNKDKTKSMGIVCKKIVSSFTFLHQAAVIENTLNLWK